MPNSRPPTATSNFSSPTRHGFARVAVCVPEVHLSQPQANVAAMRPLAQQAHDAGCSLALFPELGLSGYSNDDLFQQTVLLDATLDALAELLIESRAWPGTVLAVGLPLRHEQRLFNCAALLHNGHVLGIVPKSYLPNYREFYEKRQFSAARERLDDMVELCGQQVPFGSNLLFELRSDFVVHIEICEDLWTPIPPSTYAAMAGASVLLNLSASNITLGKAEERRQWCQAQARRCLGAYLYSAAGLGESTTDLAWDGYALISELGELLADSKRFALEATCLLADIDLERIDQERLRSTSFADCRHDHHEALRSWRRIPVTWRPPPVVPLPLRRNVARFPFVPGKAAARDAQCYEAYNIQVHGLEQRLRSSGIRKLVLGVSGGLDSTQALLVCVRALDRLGLPRSHLHAYSLPGFATSSGTRNHALQLMQALEVNASELDIRPACMQMFKDIDHPFAHGEAVYDLTFENVQAGERTSHLFRLANHHNALVVGTGDLSELALGWATYGVGDHMSHYNVNASVPKTLIQYLIRWVAERTLFGDRVSALLEGILATEISPELVPGDDTNTHPTQRTEEVVGPYALQDFHLYYLTRHGFRPSKVAFLAWQAWHDAQRGEWPTAIPQQSYTLEEIHHWLEVFLVRFFGRSQFKRSCVPNGPKVGSGGSLSPRGDWRAPSDGSAEIWLEELRRALKS